MGMEVDIDETLSQKSSERYERLYTMLLNAIPSSVLLIDRNMCILSANRNFLEKSRRSLANTVGQQLEKVFPPIIFDQMGLTSRIRQVFEKNRPIVGERMSYRAPGLPLRIYYYSILPFNWEEKVQNAIFLMEDITEQVHLSSEIKRIESHLASIVESASDIVLSTDLQGRILTWNTAAEKLSHYSFSAVKGRKLLEFFSEEHQPDAKNYFSFLKDIRTPPDRAMPEWDLMMQNGDRILVSWVFSPMKDENDQITGIVGVGRDLSERHKMQMSLLQSQKLAALGVMAGGIAHEIRNPLAVCSSASQFLMEDNITPKFRKECAEKIQTGIQKASVIIENILRFARPSVVSTMAHLNIILVLNEALSMVQNQAKIQKIRIVTHFPQEPVLITGNASLLQQVFMNLFLNAIRAMPNGGSLTLFIERNLKEVLIQSADTGEGISKINLENIFDPFYTTSPVGQGTGLGLSICYSIVKQHFGSIEVESLEGKGSTFTVRFPALL